MGQPQFSRRRRLAYGTLTGCVLLVLLAGLAEAYLQIRWTPPRSLTTPAFWDHPLYGSGPCPGLSGRQVTTEYNTNFVHNRLGMRGPLPNIGPKEPGERRLLILGDSHAYGLGCEEGSTFADHLRRSWGESAVANAGSNGYGTRESLAVLHHFGAEWEPNVVLLVFFWNDLEDNLKHSTPSFQLGANGVERLDAVPDDIAPLALQTPVQIGVRGDSGLRLRAFLKDGLRGLRYRTLGIRPRSIQTQAQKDAAWQTTAEYLTLIHHRCNELGAQLFVAVLPDQAQVDPALEIKNITPLHYEVQDLVFDWASEQGTPIVDLLPDLIAAQERTQAPLYHYADKHLTAPGHEVVGATLVQALGGLAEAGRGD